METALALVRFAHFVALLSAFGGGVFLSGLAPAAIRDALSPPLRRAALAANLVALASALVWFDFEAVSMADDWTAAYDPDTLREVLTGTSFGLVWAARLPLLAVLAAALALTKPTRWGAPTVLAGLALASLALVDHAAMRTGDVGLAHRAADALHLLAAGFWLGGLPVFALSVRAAGQSESRRDAVVAMLRFSGVGQIAVLALLITGAANIGFISGRAPWPPDTLYRALLAIKIGVVLGMIGLAMLNRLILLPRIETRASAAAWLQASCLAEIAAAVAVVALVSVFGLLDPG